MDSLARIWNPSGTVLVILHTLCTVLPAHVQHRPARRCT